MAPVINYKITAVWKVETDIVTPLKLTLLHLSVLNVNDVILTNNFQYQSHLVDSLNITPLDQRENVKFTDHL